MMRRIIKGVKRRRISKFAYFFLTIRQRGHDIFFTSALNNEAITMFIRIGKT